MLGWLRSVPGRTFLFLPQRSTTIIRAKNKMSPAGRSRSMATLYIIGTPIGNLGDITFRAVETLKAVDIVAAEDTRESGKLLAHLGIKKRMISCRARNEEKSAPGVVKLLDEGKDLAYVSDAGTPAVSDPGSLLVNAVLSGGHAVVPIPGPSALSTLFSVAGIPGKGVFFEGFLPIKPGKRKKRLAELLEREETFVLFESPYRILKLLGELAELENDREVVVGREMTKAHEEFLRGSVQEVLIDLEGRTIIKGEMSVLVSGQKNR
jgi:16S rRNA (cytidine1402-2'-O)-methyltransferase